MAAAGDRHLAEFVPGFTTSPEELFRWGVIRTPVAYRIKTWQEIGLPKNFNYNSSRR